MKNCYNCFREMPDSAKTCPHCGTSADLRNEDKYPYALPCGSALNGRYVVGRVLGQGGFGITYIGQQYDTKQLVAIKEYYPGAIATRNESRSVIPFSKDKSGDYEYGKKQFLDEAKTLSAFIGSPNIVRVYSYFEENGTAYFVMEYVRGKSLKQYVVSRGGHISWEEAWDLLMPVLEALSEVHSKKIIHRDIKPDNIIITESGRAKLIDFGAARYKHGEKSRSLTAILTPGYAPPEQYYSSGDQGPWTDVYALAATMYFCITGKNPPESIEREHAFNDSLERPSALGTDIPAYAEAALLKALSVREKERYETTYDFRNAVLEGKHREEIKSPGKDRGNSGTGSSGTANSGTGSSSGYRSDREITPEESFRKTLELAVQGDSDAQYLVGYFYESGKGVQKSGELAIKWYRRAAAQGNPAAETRLSLLSEKKNVKESGESGSKREPQPGGGNAGDGTGEESGNAVSGRGQQPGGNSDTDGKQQTLGNDSAGGVQETGTNRGAEGGAEDQGTPKPATQEKGSAGRPNKILLVAAIIAIIAVAAFVWPKTIKRELTDTWEEIIAASCDGTYKEKYRIGDTKELDMGSEGKITMKLVAMDEDELADGSGKAPMTWVADELLKTAHNMNSEDTNEGGWEASEMRAWLRETVLPLMPEEIRSNIREVTKYSYSYEEQKGVASEDTIWIPSVREVFPDGYNDWTDEHREKEGVTYTGVITDDESRVRSRDGESGRFWWWLRSASDYYSYRFNAVHTYGGSGNAHANSEGGVVVGFCLGEAVESSDSESISRTSDAPIELADTWEEIAAAGHDGTYKDRYRIGDTKELDMGSEGIITMKLVAMDEDELADGSGKAPMTWVADELLRSEHNMNSKLTNEGGWEASEMRAWLRKTVLPLMPEEVRDNIREVTKYSYSHEEQKGAASKDTIWIPSVREVFPAGYNDWTDEYREQEGVSYTGVIKDDESRMRSRDGESGASWWWLRSASTTGSYLFDSVYSGGDFNYTVANSEDGVVVGFCF